MAGIRLVDAELIVSGECILTGVHDNVLLSPVTCEGSIDGAFIGVKSDQNAATSRNVFPIGNLHGSGRGLRFLSLFRFKMWWMTQWIGTCGKDIPPETQFLIIQCAEQQQELYVVLLPLLERDFRAVLQGNEQNDIEICLESGDPAVKEFQGSRLIFIACGINPFDLITDAVKTVEKHLQTFCHRERKTIPDMLNWFGWCTWDAFYTDVSAEGVKRGITSLEKGKFPPKFVIIDDGWQTVGMDPTGTESKADDSANFADRLLNIKENDKFREEGASVNSSSGFHHFIPALKENHALRYIYVWHAITGYWGGVNPNVPAMKSYGARIVDPIPSPGVESNAACNVLKSIILNKVGLVDPNKAFEFYNDLHEYLSYAGVDGVKVDVQAILETLGDSQGGRVNLARKYHQALEDSVSRNFRGNEIISCMSHNTDTLYSGKKTAVIRASDDFFPRDPASHTVHVASVAYNSVFIGEFMQPDWDMFHSLHPMAEYHGAARAVGGCAVYVSDKPECHDFDLLKKLVLPDGSVLRAKLPGRPTKDCLFCDPTRDMKSLLKIWNLNELSGVIGVFNCQGATWCRTLRKNMLYEEHATTITCSVYAKDVEYLSRVAGDKWEGSAIVYSHQGGEVHYVEKDSGVEVSLGPREYQVFTVVPVRIFQYINNNKVPLKFGPVGLLDMFNSGGAVTDVKHQSDGGLMRIQIGVRGCGRFGAYSSERPKRVTVEEEEVEFEYEQESGLMTIILDVPKHDLYQWRVMVSV